MDAPRKSQPFGISPTSPVSPTRIAIHHNSPLLGKGSYDEELIDAGLVIPTITAQLREYLYDIDCRSDKLFHFCVKSEKKDRAAKLLHYLRTSWALKKHGCYIAGGCFLEKCLQGTENELIWIVTLKIRNPSDLMLSIICEYLRSNNFNEDTVYEVLYKQNVCVKCEFSSE